MELSDAAAVAQVRAGQQDAFRVLVERHSRTIFRLGFRMTGNEDDANDVVQETFLRAYRRLDSFEERSSFGTWLYRIASNCALDLLEKRQPRDKFRSIGASEFEDEEPLDLPSHDPSPERVVVGAQLRGRIDEILRSLSPPERVAFVMRHFEDKSIEEIAGALKIRPGAAKNSIFRAVQKIRKRLEPATRTAL